MLEALILIALAAYRLTRLIGVDTITEGLRDRIAQASFNMEHPHRQRVAQFATGAIDCPHCLSVWAAGLVALIWLIPVVGPALVLVGAVAGVVSLIYTLLQDTENVW
jgi:uncharacterized membrane protein